MNYRAYGVLLLWSAGMYGMEEQVQPAKREEKEVLIASIAEKNGEHQCFVVQKKGTQCKPLGVCYLSQIAFDQYAEDSQFVLIKPDSSNVVVKKISLERLLLDESVIAAISKN